MSSTKKNLLPIVYIVAILAAVGVGVGFYTMKQGASSLGEQVADVNEANQDAIAAVNEAGEGKTAQQADAEDAAETAQTTTQEPAAGETPAASAAVDGREVKPGNPIVAKVDDQPITRVDVFRYIQGMPQQVQQMPPAQIYPMALEQVIDTRLIQNKAEAANLEEDPEFKVQMSLARQQIERAIYVQREVDKRISESDMKDKYNQYVKQLADIEERHARHILVDSEEKAKEVITKLNGGADFAALVTEYSTGPSTENGGDLGWFAKQDMVPAFAEAAFATQKGTVNATPVQTQFGWHVIKVEDTRKRPAPTFEELTPVIQAELRREIVDGLVKDWRKDASIEVFDINGEPLNATSPAAGDDKAAEPAKDAAPAAAPEAPAEQPASQE